MTPEYRPARPEDLPQAMALWQRAFGDDAAFVERCLERFVGPGQLYVAGQGAEVLAILSAVPCGLKGNKGVYLYALATDEKARGAGVMSALMGCAETREAGKGAAFAALVPASARLFDYYRRRGYDVDVPLRRLELAPAVPGAAAAPLVERQPDTLAALRQKWLKAPVLTFDAGRMAVVAEDLRETGAVLAESDDGYLVWLEGGQRVLVAELAARDDAAAGALLAGLAARLPAKPVTVTLPAGNGLFTGQGEVVPYGLIKPLSKGGGWAGGYMRFVMDEMWA